MNRLSTLKITGAALALTFTLGALSPAPAADKKAEAGGNGVPKSYPLKKCVVSDEELGEHGKAVKVTAPDGTDVYLCCKDCLKDFKKDPQKYAKMVKEAKK